MNTRFSLIKRRGEYIGVGYKQMQELEIPPFGKWHSAKYDPTKPTYTKSDAKSKTITCENMLDQYIVGFHIFLNEWAARNYSSKSKAVVYRVEFKNVTAFGSNTTYLNQSDADCVVAQDIRYIERLS